MGAEYRVSSSVKVEQLEAELSHQLSTLRELIGKRGLEQTQDSGTYRCAAVILTPPQHHCDGKLATLQCQILVCNFFFLRQRFFFNNGKLKSLFF